MRESEQRFVTVGTFPDVTLAYLAKGRLEEAGIESYIANENSGGWVIGLPTNWPEIQVAESDALRAIAVLESQFGKEETELPEDEVPAPEGAITLRDQFARFGARPLPAEAESPAEDRPQEEEPPPIDDTVPEDRSAVVDRAYKAALFGLLFLPIMPYSIYVLLKAWDMEGPLDDRARRRAWITGVLNLLWLMVVGWLVLSFVRG